MGYSTTGETPVITYTPSVFENYDAQIEEGRTNEGLQLKD